MDGHNRRRAAIVRQASRTVPRDARRRGILVFFAETRDNPLARMPRHIVLAAFAHLSNSGHSRRSSRHPPIIADPRQAFTNLKIVKHGPSGAPSSAPAFREPARRSDAARQACEQEARRR
ncbi:hypothetical protein [Burkholderia ubonensis]|uniref:hypothetical protein n=1 Tax=Burkholderia ubonensis TaxID=101571 RepID=UPI000A5E467D|nr:hypothetical protein [Burkholderia ubonensis]MDY7787159.1 hypothetical protein [Burkholderia ubonensis]